MADNPDTDFRLFQLGERSILEITSTKAMDELDTLVPDIIDRTEPEHTVIGHLMPKAFVLLRTTEDMEKRKKATIAALGVHKASTNILKMIVSVDTFINTLQIGQEINFQKLAQHIIFENLSCQLLGEDYRNINLSFGYTCPGTGEVLNLSFSEFFIKLCKSEVAAFSNPMVKVLQPFSNFCNLIEPFKTNRKNNLYLRKRLLELAEASTDPNSMYKILMRSGEFSSED